MAGGQIVGTQTIVSNGPAAKRFNIVILGDGFQRSELGTFDAKAALLTQKLLAMTPFKTVKNLINVHTVRTASTDSGVSKVPTPNVSKTTFYNVTGSFQVAGITGPDAPASFLGTPTPQKVLAAARLATPLETVRLFIVLVNVTDYAYSADPDRSMVFASLDPDDRIFVGTTAHECCHVIARTAEEYQDCNGPPTGRTYPNQMTEKERLAGNLKWKFLAKPNELNTAGGFKAVHRFGDKSMIIDPVTHTPSFALKPALDGMLGLFWQCQDIKPGKGDCVQYEDPRGKHFYRPMAACKMRFVTSDFCRVCAHEMEKRIRGFAV